MEASEVAIKHGERQAKIAGDPNQAEDAASQTTNQTLQKKGLFGGIFSGWFGKKKVASTEPTIAPQGTSPNAEITSIKAPVIPQSPVAKAPESPVASIPNPGQVSTEAVSTSPLPPVAPTPPNISQFPAAQAPETSTTPQPPIAPIAETPTGAVSTTAEASNILQFPDSKPTGKQVVTSTQPNTTEASTTLENEQAA